MALGTLWLVLVTGDKHVAQGAGMLSPNKSVTDTLRAFANLTSVLNVGSYCPSSSRVTNVRDKPTFTASCSCVRPRLVRTR